MAGDVFHGRSMAGAVGFGVFGFEVLVLGFGSEDSLDLTRSTLLGVGGFSSSDPHRFTNTKTNTTKSTLTNTRNTNTKISHADTTSTNTKANANTNTAHTTKRNKHKYKHRNIHT